MSKADAGIRPNQPSKQSDWVLWLPAAGLFFFYALLFDVGADGTVTAKIMTLLVCGGMILLLLLKRTFSVLAERISPLFLVVTGYVLICGVSTFYALSGKFALKEFCITLCSYGLFVLICGTIRANETSAREVAAVVSTALGAFSLISIDSASLKWLTAAFKWIIGLFTPVFENNGGFETGTRITSIFANPNVYAGVTAIGILLTLYLVRTESRQGRRNFFLGLLAVNSLGFLLAFSMGGTAMFVLSALVYLIASGKNQRLPVFILMLETGVSTVLMAAVSYMGLGHEGPAAAIPMAALALNVVLLILLERFVGERLAAFLQARQRLSILLVIVLAGLIILYGVAGCLLTSSYTFRPKETLRRAAYPSGGAFQLTVESDAPFTVRVESQNDAQTQLHTSSVLYRGEAADAAFTVPEDARVVYVSFTAPEGGTLSKAVLQGEGESHSLPLKYPLFPGFVANRLQGLFANENAIQRLVFFRDGLRVFAQSPIVGSGLGSFENALFGVQDFYYTTKYVHNHYIQSLADTGILGFVFFTGTLVLMAVGLFRRRREDRGCFAPLAACLTMIAGHSLVEVSFSTQIFQPTAFIIFGLIAVNFSAPLPGKALRLGCRYGGAVFAGVFALLLSGNLFAKVIRSEGSFDALAAAARIDFYEKNDSKLTYVIYSTEYDSPQLQSQAAQYAADLRKVKSNSISAQLVRYYIQVGRYEDAFDCMEEGLLYTRSNPQAWDAQLINLEFAFSPDYNPSYEKLLEKKEKWVERSLGIVELLKERNRTMMDTVTIQPRSNRLIGCLYELRELSDPEEIYNLLINRIFSLNGFSDLDENGIPDAIAVRGRLVPEGAGFQVTGGTRLTLNAFHDLGGAYRLDLGCDPAAVAAISFDGQETELHSDGNGVWAEVVLEENVVLSNLAAVIVFAQDTRLDRMDFTRVPANG